MPIELRQHFVAFLDILGFSEMVKSDINGNNQVFLAKLFRCHQNASQIFNDDPDCSITQFSDSVVIAKPFEASAFTKFATQVAEYQRLLLDEEMLCRGGFAVNKHFSNGTFTFSAGLISAYNVESKSARYPRVAISPEGIDLVFPDLKKIPRFIIEEDDGIKFIDYIGVTAKRRPKKLLDSVANVTQSLKASENPSIREKGLWLAAYSDAVLRTGLSEARFKGKSIKDNSNHTNRESYRFSNKGTFDDSTGR